MTSPRKLTLALAFFLAIGCDKNPFESQPTAAAVGQLEETTGKVQLERAGQTRPAVLGYLYRKDALETGSDGSARLRLKGRQIEVGPDARLVIEEDQSGILLQVQRGLVLTRVPKEGDPNERNVALSILTPFGITRFGAGENEAQVEVGPKDAKVAVKLGLVEFFTRDGKQVAFKAGDSFSMGQIELEQKKKEEKPPELVLQTIQVTLHATTGKAEVRRRGTSRWKKLSRKSQPIEPGDAVRATTGPATLALEGTDSSIGLAQGSEVALSQAGRLGDLTSAAMDVRKGEVEVRLGSKAKHRISVTDLQLENEGDGFFVVTKQKDDFLVTAVAGDASLSRNGKIQPVRAGQQVRISKQGHAATEESRRSEVVLPTRSGIRVFAPASQRVTLGWEGGAGDYRVEVGSDPEFKTPSVSGVVHRPYVTLDAPEKGTLHWRVTRADGQKVSSGSAFFSPERPTKDLARLRNEVPASTEKTTIFFQDKPPGVTFTYAADQKAAKYRLAVFKADALDKPVAERVVKETQIPLEAGALNEGSYLWSVTPLSAAGEELRGGKMNKLEIVYDNSVPTLVIQAPKNGQPALSSVRAAGVAPVGSKLAINGKPVALDDKNRFDLEVAPIGRPPVIVFRLSKPPHPDTFTIRTLHKGR